MLFDRHTNAVVPGAPCSLRGVPRPTLATDDRGNGLVIAQSQAPARTAPPDQPLYARREPRTPGGIVPAKRVHHVDPAVSDVERSLASYLDLLGPLGWKVTRRYPTYRGTSPVLRRWRRARRLRGGHEG